ncbi:uncharacterized protein LOC129985328 [Argiope bruennichi]|uniref:Uncharacterized protein n=1 Tax=Argiope bruennichi TaxID=94029 RepID=A0A8T0EIF1_ARGBR|nr:uncharacterized protein LOC129985328 [Argiope bruennichi]KAF8773677.1 hypothetical protein HNY73_016314 [Argiope bruennichi]
MTGEISVPVKKTGEVISDGICQHSKPNISAEVCMDLEDELFYRKMEYKSKLFTMAYFFIVIALCSGTVCLFIWWQPKHVSSDNVSINNALKFNMSEIKFAEPSTMETNQSINELHLRKNYLITITYQVDKGEDVLRCISIISLLLLLISLMGMNPYRDDCISDTPSEEELKYIIIDNFDKFITKPRHDVKYVFIERHRVVPAINKYSISLFLLGMVFLGLIVAITMCLMEPMS